MKKLLFAAIAIAGLGTVAQAQNAPVETSSSSDNGSYNKWSIELNGGVNKYQKPATPGFYSGTPSPWNADLGIRYMFNNKFGLKLDAGYSNIKDGKNSLEFESHLYRANLQAVANLGRIMNFETWTNTFGLLAHSGFGYAQLKSEGQNFTDRMGSFILGVTPQIRLSDRVALTGDLSTIYTVGQSRAFDGASVHSGRGFDGLIFQGTVGLTFYLGGNQKHADWYATESETQNQLNDLESRLSTVERGLVDSDQDGIADMYDVEPNSPAGVAVDSKGRAIDRNKNGVPDEMESYLDSRIGNNSNNSSTSGGALNVKDMINGGYVNVYFDFNSATPTKESTAGINFLVNYLNANKSASADVIGYADEIGDAQYNKELSRRRAENVKQILVDSGISASRLNVIGNGEDSSVNKSSKAARNIVRRVTFQIK